MSSHALARTAGILCSNADFRHFLAERFPIDWKDFSDLEDAERAASVLRSACKIKSRSELDSSAEARHRYHIAIGLPYSSWRTRLASG